MLYLAEDQKMISKTEIEEMKKMAMSVSKMIGALIASSLRNNEEE
jgi:hypothetical protein